MKEINLEELKNIELNMLIDFANFVMIIILHIIYLEERY